jgi:hypothetical protein
MRQALVLLMLMLSQLLANAAERLPVDVRQFIDRREACDHFRGEPWDMGEASDVRQRREFVFAQVKRSCRGTDRALSQLRKKYRGNARISKRLRDYETLVETP